jgi:hypothetical protein
VAVAAVAAAVAADFMAPVGAASVVHPVNPEWRALGTHLDLRTHLEMLAPVALAASAALCSAFTFKV